jgi:hypothetical protein
MMRYAQKGQNAVPRASVKRLLSVASRSTPQADGEEMRVKTALFGSLKKLFCREPLGNGCPKWLVRLAQ